MNGFFDTHAHFDTFEERGMTDEIIERAKQSGVQQIVAVGSSAQSNSLVIQLSERYRGYLACAVGYDRDQATRAPSVAQLEDMLSSHEVCAIGEIGLDYHYDADTARQQRELFVKMLETARLFNKPVCIHSREADADTLAILDEHIQELNGEKMAGILHCFTGSSSFAEEVLSRGLYISFSGILTFSSAGTLHDLVRTVPAGRLLIETDCPYLAPVPCRGKVNEPSYIRHTAEKLSCLIGQTLEDTAALTARNACAVFKLSLPAA